ncbi:hypothetical protein FF2_014055 [Malus domestica]|uniref:Uncharacterized protein n=1 Tax=Malus domestica TaxID=3750 RepID=A0A498I5F2_MALDO|nr:hypothetical protein DVH24_019589 [Malus domestica]
MKRRFDDFEIFDEEWDKHSSTFKPSCVLKKPRTLTPRPIESFDFRSSPKPQQLYDEDENSDCVEIKPELEDNDSDCVVIKNEWAPGIIADEGRIYGFGDGSESKGAPEIAKIEIRAVVRTWCDEASQEDLGKQR